MMKRQKFTSRLAIATFASIIRFRLTFVKQRQGQQGRDNPTNVASPNGT